MPPTPFALPLAWQPLRQWLPAAGALVAAVLVAIAGLHASPPDASPALAEPARANAIEGGGATAVPTARPATASLGTAVPVPMASAVPERGIERRAPAVAAADSLAPTAAPPAPLPAVVARTTRSAAEEMPSQPTQLAAAATFGDTTAMPTTAARPPTAASPTAVDAAPITSLARVAAAWLLALAVLMAGAVAYIVRVLPRLPVRRAVAVTGAGCAALTVAGSVLAVWADAGMAGWLMSALLVALPALTVASGHGGYALGRAEGAAHARRSNRAARRSTRATASTASTASPTDLGPHTEPPAHAAVDRAQLGNFRIEGELGRGAMGVVYLGRHQRTSQRVALKTLAVAAHRDGTDGAEAQRRFLREAAMATRLRHPDIVAVVGSGEQQGLAYIAMEYVEGHDLCRHTRADALLPLPVLVDAVARVADALAYAHAQGVVHRDIKPANLMWNPVTRQVKVADFGVARVVDGGRTSTGVLMGTPTHLAPEQLAGRTLDGRTDLYALGVTLYQLITGQLPQRAESMARLMFEIANVQAPDVRRLRPDTPPALAAIVARLLEKRPDDRYADGRTLAADLRAVLVAAGPSAVSFTTPAAIHGIAPPPATGHNSAF